VLEKLRTWLLAAVVTSVYWVLSRFWFVKEKGVVPAAKGPDPKDSPRIYAHWHTDELLLIYVCIFRKMAIMASRSKDGELMKRVLSNFGFRVVRGSSTRGGAAGLKGLIDVVIKEKRHASLAVDGPHGPIFKVKPGILKLAQESGLPIIPGVASASKRFVFKKAWNRCYLPLPFSKCTVLYGEPIEVPKDISEEALSHIREHLEKRLLELKAQVEDEYQRKFDPILFSAKPIPA
jgi:lysophospholipid acyltransferase (LPLAT)-like uncharacterized protein